MHDAADLPDASAAFDYVITFEHQHERSGSALLRRACSSHGPFEVLEKVGRSAYNLKLPPTWRRLYPTVNEIYLTPYQSPTFPSQQRPPPPPPELVDGNEEYEVDYIVDSKVERGRIKYLVHWKGYGDEAREWLTLTALQNAPEAIEEFHRKHPNAP